VTKIHVLDYTGELENSAISDVAAATTASYQLAASSGRFIPAQLHNVGRSSSWVYQHSSYQILCSHVLQ